MYYEYYYIYKVYRWISRYTFFRPFPIRYLSLSSAFRLPPQPVLIDEMVAELIFMAKIFGGYDETIYLCIRI